MKWWAWLVLVVLLAGCSVTRSDGVATQTRVAEVIELTVVARTNATVAAVARTASPPTPTAMATATPAATPIPTATTPPTASPTPSPTSAPLAPIAASQSAALLLTAVPAASSASSASVSAAPQQWVSPDRHLTLQYPAVWQITTDDSPGNLLTLNGPEATFFFVNAFAFEKPAAAALADFHTRHLANATRTYTDGPIQPTTVGGQAAALMSYTSVSKANPADIHTGEVWYVDGGAMQYLIEAYANGPTIPQATAVAAIVASVMISA